MTIDFHTHTFPDSLAPKAVPKLAQSGGVAHYSDGTLSGLRISMERAGVDLSVILPVATGSGQVSKLNDLAAANNQNWQGVGFFSFGAMHPDFSGWKEELARVKAEGLKGVKIHPPYQQTPLDDIRYLRILDRCAELDLIVVTHAGIDVGVPGNWCSPDMCAEVYRQIPWNKLVLAHLGGWRQWGEVEEKLAGKDLYLDTAFVLGSIEPAPGCVRPERDRWLVSREQFCRIVERHGAQRILFATDSPWQDPKQTLSILNSMPLSDEEKAAIRGGSAQKLLGLQ